jgi:hypothetical protein
MTQRLVDIQVLEVSLVDDPANQHAKVEIVKRAQTQKGDQMNEFKPCSDCGNVEKCGEMKKCMGTKKSNSGDPTMSGDVQKALDTANQTIAKQAADIEALKVAATGKDAEIAKLKADLNPPSEEEVLKAATPALRAMLQKAKDNEVELAKMREKDEQRDAIEKARAEVPGCDADKLGPVIMRVRKGKSTEDDATYVIQLLKSAQAVRETATIYNMNGSMMKTDASDPYTQLEAVAGEIQKANPTLSAEKAMEKAMSSRRDLYTAYVNKQRAGAR